MVDLLALNISVKTDAVDRAGASLDEMSAAAGRADRAVAGVERSSRTTSSATDRLAAHAQQAMQQLQALERYSQQASGTDYISASRRADEIAAYGQELDRLRAKFNPMFAASQRYEATVAEINQAHRVGAISADEMTAALGREKAAFDRLNASANDNGVKSHNSAGLAAQLQDVAVTSAMGMSPLQIGLQQGTQFSAMLQAMKTQGQSTGAALVAAFTSVVSPMSLLTIGLIAGTAAAIQYFSSLGGGAKSADDALEKHASTIARLKDAYGKAAEGVREYATESGSLLEAAGRKNVSELAAQARTANRELADVFGNIVGAHGEGIYRVDERFRPFSDAIKDLQQSVVAGKPDFDQFQRQVDAIADADGGRLRGLGDDVLITAEKALRMEQALQAAESAARLLGSTAMAEAGKVREFGDALAGLENIALPNLTPLEEARQRFEKGMAGSTDKFQRDAIQRGYAAAVQRIGDREAEKAGEEAERESKRFAQAGARVSDAYKDIIASAEDRIAQQQIEQQALGLTTEQANALRYAHDLLNQAQQAGVKIGPEQRAQLTSYAEKMAEAEEATRAATQAQEDQARVAGQALGVLGDAVTELFSGGIDSADEFFSFLAKGFLDIGKGNLTKFLDPDNLGKMFGPQATNDNGATWFSALGDSVRDGAKTGTEQGAFGGLNDWFKNAGFGGGAAGAASAGLGGIGLGYAAANPMTGALGGAMAGAGMSRARSTPTKQERNAA